jgi:hypothetical protein
VGLGGFKLTHFSPHMYLVVPCALKMKLWYSYRPASKRLIRCAISLPDMSYDHKSTMPMIHDPSDLLDFTFILYLAPSTRSGIVHKSITPPYRLSLLLSLEAETPYEFFFPVITILSIGALINNCFKCWKLFSQSNVH